MPTFAIDFFVVGLASLPVVLSGLPLYALQRSTRELKQETIESVAEKRRVTTSGSAPPAFASGLLPTLLVPADGAGV